MFSTATIASERESVSEVLRSAFFSVVSGEVSWEVSLHPASAETSKTKDKIRASVRVIGHLRILCFG